MLPVSSCSTADDIPAANVFGTLLLCIFIYSSFGGGGGLIHYSVLVTSIQIYDVQGVFGFSTGEKTVGQLSIRLYIKLDE